LEARLATQADDSFTTEETSGASFAIADGTDLQGEETKQSGGRGKGERSTGERERAACENEDERLNLSSEQQLKKKYTTVKVYLNFSLKKEVTSGIDRRRAFP
jgi:hypothetical protein